MRDLGEIRNGNGMTGWKIEYAWKICIFGDLVPAASDRSGGGGTVELVMFESDSCEWCEMWHEEVGVIYAKTTEAEKAPLRRVSIEDPVPADLVHVHGIHYTPTFVLIENGIEVGRILGYPGEDFFWGLLGMELEKLKSHATVDNALSGASGCADNSDRERADEKADDGTVAC